MHGRSRVSKEVYGICSQKLPNRYPITSNDIAPCIRVLLPEYPKTII